MTRRDDPAKPWWVGDEVESDDPIAIEAAYFDQELNSWILSRHADVLAAFRTPGLALAGPNHKKGSEPHDESIGLRVREETAQALCPAQIRAWREELERQAERSAGTLALDRPVDVVGEYARPLCLMLATMITGVDPREAQDLQGEAQVVSDSAAEPYDADLRARAKVARVELAAHFHSGPELLRGSGFVALSQTLQRMLGSGWFVLLRNPQAWGHLHQQPELTESAVEEMLRCAGLPRVLFRTATQDVNINGLTIRKGERVILRIAAANRDPAYYGNANQFDCKRRAAGHLTLGAGLHTCTGANLIRMGAVAITRPLLERFRDALLARPVEWHGGAGFRSPVALWVRLTE